MVHFRSLLDVDRSDLESLILTIAGWDQFELRQRHLPDKRLFVVDTLGDDRLAIALDVAAAASGYHRIRVPERIVAKPSALVGEVVPLADLVVAAAPESVVRPLLDQDQVPVVWLREGRTGAVDDLGRTYRSFLAGNPLRDLSARDAGAALASRNDGEPLDVRTLACAVAALLEYAGRR